MFPLSIFAGAGAFDPVVLLLLVLVVDALVGEVPRGLRLLPNPMAAVAWATGGLDARLNRERRSQGDRAVRGVLVVVVLSGLAALVGLLVSWLAWAFTWGWLLEFALVFALVSQRGVFDRLRALARALAAGGTEEARAAVGALVPFETAALDAHGLARTAIEACVEHFAARVVGPVFWYLFLGLPGTAAYMTVNRMAGVIGAGSWRYAAFGLTSARLDDALGFFPARLAGLYLALGAIFVPTGRPLAALKVMLRDAGKHVSLNEGWPSGAAAGALDLALLGPGARPGWGDAANWIGEGRAQATAQDVKRALYLYAVACLLNAGMVVALALVRLTA
ncbi:MAG: cobalamin biosynthesis protein [Proteobacteria bacterium]|nr:cobalamin biosynthesis protein [Pseudomonadota bacterium]